MKTDHIEYQIRRKQLDFLVNKVESSNWGILLMALAFSYFYWESAPRNILYLWLALNFAITVCRTLFVYPRYRQAEITPDNIDGWLRWFTFTLGITGLNWGLALPFFVVPDNTQLLLVLMFTFFTLMVSATLTLASHMQGFIAFIFPLTASIAWIFFAIGERVYTEFGIAFILFSIFTVSFYKSTNQEITKLITLEIEKQGLVQDLEEKGVIADRNRLIAEQSVNDKNRFLAAASHDLRQPLHASGLLLAALGKHVPYGEGQQLLDEVLESNRALGNSFNSLLDISKLGAGVVEVNTTDLAIDELMEGLEKEFVNQASDKGLSLVFNGPDLALYSDQTLLMRVLRNLISNAIKYTDTGGIEVSWSHANSENRILVEIADTGIGIAETEIKEIFSEYYQIHNPERDRSRGFGLGLAIVKQLCDLLNINLHVESSLDAGTRFSMRTAVGELAKVKRSNETQSPQMNLSKLTILLIDDDVSVLSSMDSLLTSWGCNVIQAESADQAVAQVAAIPQKPDFIFADYRLRNNETGVQACEKVYDELNHNLPTLIITGDTSPTRLQEVVESGYSILHKPVAPSQLRSFIQTELIKRSMA